MIPWRSGPGAGAETATPSSIIIMIIIIIMIVIVCNIIIIISSSSSRSSSSSSSSIALARRVERRPGRGGLALPQPPSTPVRLQAMSYMGTWL